MGLRLYNTRTRRKEEFRPIVPGRVGLYVCGLTVYDHAHIGHARTYTSFEVVRRWLEHRAATEGWGDVVHVQNVTDVDDKIIARAAETGASPRAWAATWDKQCHAALDRLGIRRPHIAPHVTEHIEGIVAFISDILRREYAYATPAGNVYFDVPRYAAGTWADAAGIPCGYGTLSNRDYREMAAGTRKEVEDDKRHPADFALWKAAGDEHPDASWDSPWGRGRPGWHIECSRMATDALGDRIDIHGGGQDLVFPHHENEVAQSQAKTGKAPFVNVWMHTGFLNVEGEKMSKSLGNFITLESALGELAATGQKPDVLRFYFVQTHYRSKIDYSRAGLAEAAAGLARLELLRIRLAEQEGPGSPEADSPLEVGTRRLRDHFVAAMDDDIHTPGAVAALFDFARLANRVLDTGASPADCREARNALEWCGQMLTLFDAPPAIPDDRPAPGALVELARQHGLEPSNAASATHASKQSTNSPWSEKDLMGRLVAFRQAARDKRDWKTSDALRDGLRDLGYVLEDTPGGMRWRRA